MKHLLLSLAFGCLFVIARADIRLPAVIASGMVLQQNSIVKIWGWCNPLEKISLTTSWNNRTYQATGSRDAGWQVAVETPAAGGPYTISIQGSNRVLLQDILVGEVWVCAGQSNMEMNFRNGHLQDIRDELPGASTLPIRFFHIPLTTAASPQNDCAAQWEHCDSNSLQTFSAVGYFFGKRISRELHVPVGLIEVSWGGTTAEVWTPDSIIRANAVLQKAAAAIEPSGMCPFMPGYAYNGMIAPITNYVIAGTIWYQGENNTSTATSYAQLFSAMMKAWRNSWQHDFPFYYVQIAPYTYRLKNVGALLREAQVQCMQQPNTGMVVTTDLVSDTNNVHPPDKHDVGWRLASWALAETYHRKDQVYRNPLYKSMQIKKDKVYILLNNAANGVTTRGAAPAGLQVAGDDRVFYPAWATLGKNRLIVWSKPVKHPVAVRYAFSNTAVGNLFNKEGLPLSPFRTDDWPVEIK